MKLSTKSIGKRLSFFFLMVLLLAGLFQKVTEFAILRKTSLSGAFSVLQPERQNAAITVTAQYDASKKDDRKSQLLKQFAKEISLKLDGETRTVLYEGREELVFEKEAKAATTILKIVTLTETEEVFLCAEFQLYDVDSQTAAAFLKKIKKKAEKQGLFNISASIELCGIFPGELPLSEKDRVTDRLLSELFAKPVYENRENDAYTVYAYTGACENAVVVGQKKINVQTAIVYHEKEDYTEVILASPLGLR